MTATKVTEGVRTLGSGEILAENLDPSATGITGEIKAWPGIFLPSGGGFLFLDGIAKSRTTYAALFAEIAHTVPGATTDTSPIITGMSEMTDVPVGCPVSGDGIPNGSVVLTVDSDTQITLDQNATASATVDVTCAPHGTGDHSTTFDLPQAPGRVFIGVGTSDAADATEHVLGGKAGTETHTLITSEMPAHVHGQGGTAGASNTAGGTGRNDYNETNTTSTGGDGAHNNLQPSLGIHFIIKT